MLDYILTIYLSSKGAEVGTYLIENTFNPFDTKRISDKYLLECRKIWEETSKNKQV